MSRFFLINFFEFPITNNSFIKVGDDFMRKIEAIAARIAYMTSPGNHGNNSFYHFERVFFLSCNL